MGSDESSSGLQVSLTVSSEDSSPGSLVSDTSSSVADSVLVVQFFH